MVLMSKASLIRLSLECLEGRHLLTGIPALNSLPNAPHKLFLDFDGHVVKDTLWNTSHFTEIHAPPFNADAVEYAPDGRPSFSNFESP